MEVTTETAVDSQTLAESARARAAFAAFLNLHFMTLPDEAFVEQMRSPACAEMLERIQHDPSAGPDLAAGAAHMRAALEATRAEPPAALAQMLGVERTRLYRGVTPRFGPPPPYEMVWSKTFADVTLLTALAARYRDAGLMQAADSRERADYIGVELDFVQALAAQEAEAWTAGAHGQAASLRAAQRSFMDQHLAAWVPAYVEQALGHAQTGFYRGHLLLLRGFLAAEQQALAERPAGAEE